MGCTKVSEGCDHCYMFREQRQYGNDPELVRRSKTKFNEPLKWDEGRLVFTCSWSDWFHVDADPWRDEAWEIIRRTPQHTYQILTKRPGRILRHLPEDWGAGYPNVWLGVSVESAAFLNRVDVLRDVPAALRFISAEPLLGSLLGVAGSSPARQRAAADGSSKPDSPPGAVEQGQAASAEMGAAPPPGGHHIQNRVISPDTGHGPSDVDAQSGGPSTSADGGPSLDLSGIGWIIVGGESGGRQTSRPMHPQWAREIRDKIIWGDQIPCGDGCCEPEWPRPEFHFKQWGSWVEDPYASRDPRGGVWVAPDGRVETPLSMDALGLGEEMNGAVRMGYAGPNPKAGGKLLDGVEWCEIPSVLTPA